MKQNGKKLQKKKQKHFNNISNNIKQDKMKSSTLLLFPNQLFSVEYLSNIIKTNNINEIIFIEHPIYFGYKHSTTSVSSSTPKKYNFNKLKIIYHFACNNYFHENILSSLKSNDIKIDFIELKNFTGFNKLKIKNNYEHGLIFFDTLNIELNNEIQSAFKQHIELDNPVLLTPKKQLETYAKKHTKGQNHSAFYNWNKKRLGILIEERKAYDIQQKLPKEEEKKIPEIPKLNTTDLKYILQAIKRFEKTEYQSLFSKNNGPIENDGKITSENFIFGVTHSTAEEYLDFFIKRKFNKFAKYQDSILAGSDKRKSLLYHSGLSPMMNTGLLLPETIITKVKKHYTAKKIDKGNYEAFIRQIIGWREYQYYIYKYHLDKVANKNYFKNNNNISREWYTATTKITPVDDAIKTAFNYGYLHHILRLMVVANFMNLSQIKPQHVFNWFMEFSLDSYEWVMYCNVYSMGLWSDGGTAMRKPYISSNNYIHKMSNYSTGKGSKASEEDKYWNEIWYSIFYNFVADKSSQLKGTYYAGLIKFWENKKKEEKKEIIFTAKEFLSYIKRKNNTQQGGQQITQYKLVNKFTSLDINKLFKNVEEHNNLNEIKKINIENKLIDVIYNLDNDKLLMLWKHNKNTPNTITAGLKGIHYYILYNKELISNNKITLAGKFIHY